ncbi:VOC family protein [Montanilutibacter psychrotolerans]|uniref:Glyoxalase n=1 Tax=Montanilutibacter psychrotolerans TaxID=1327343 RepID=A0A3M8ST76_9GAMM|nr:VOC family protein [Lysobacter psychrotolerans]RNF82686.1 glyoxalase [Lysobacter psychrotolerans]
MNRTASTVIPCLRYRDALAAIEWLCTAFGFERHAVYADGNTVHHAQLTFGEGGMIMLGSVDAGGEWGERMAQPDEIGGRQTQSCCVIVADADAHFARATAAGAVVEIALADQDYGGRGYACRDPEGHLWWFGSYNPWTDA